MLAQARRLCSRLIISKVASRLRTSIFIGSTSVCSEASCSSIAFVFATLSYDVFRRFWQWRWLWPTATTRQWWIWLWIDDKYRYVLVSPFQHSPRMQYRSSQDGMRYQHVQQAYSSARVLPQASVQLHLPDSDLQTPPPEVAYLVEVEHLEVLVAALEVRGARTAELILFI